MSWPYQFTYPQNQLYQGGITDFTNPFYFNGFNSNQMLSTLLNPFFDFAPEFSMFPTQLNQNQAHNFETFGCLPQLTQEEFKIQQNLAEAQQSQQHQNLSKESQLVQNNSESSSKSQMDVHPQKLIKKQRNKISHNCSLRNDTKNIPKNYGKAVLSYIQKNTRQVKQILEKYQVDFLQFMILVKSFKKKINTIHDLRQVWGQNDKQNKFTKCTRILSYHFMRKKCLPYIFNSRIRNYHTHIKYRKKIMEGIKNPENFTQIKEF